MSRLDRWKAPVQILTLMSGDDEEVLAMVNARASRSKLETAQNAFSLAGFVGASREIIFELRDGLPYFTFIMFAVNAETLKIELESRIEALPPDDASPDELTEHVCQVLAFATAAEVPVYPNTAADEPELIHYYRILWRDGVKLRDESGEKKRFVMTAFAGRDFQSPGVLDDMVISEHHSPGEWAVIRETLRAELRQRDEAGRVLELLRSAIADLSGALTSATKANEHELQRCLTRNPVLFGPDYVRVLPKHPLGAEFEVDYALERTSGLIDLLEIESSVHPLYTRGNNPSSYLVHAEQQVMDWIDWIERNGSYARNSLPGLLGPTGYVVIGRRSEFTQEQAGHCLSLASQGDCAGHGPA